MKKQSVLRMTRILLNIKFKSLEDLVRGENPSNENAIEHINIKLMEAYLNAMKELEYFYRDNGLNGRVKKNYPAELKEVHRALKNYAELSVSDNQYSELVLKDKFKLKENRRNKKATIK